LPDISSLLESTTPVELRRPDLDELARRGRRRRRHQRARVRAASLSVFVVAVLVVVQTSWPFVEDDSRPSHPSGEVAVGDSLGAWQEAAAPPFTPRSDALGAPLSDGRALVWGGAFGTQVDGHLDEAEDGAIYDPASNLWTPIDPPAGEEIPVNGGMQVTDDRLAVLALDYDEAPQQAWVYDVGVARWALSPAVPDVGSASFRLLWDGETVVLYHLQERGSEDQSATLRWRPGDDRWFAGSPSPLGPRGEESRAFDGSRLAVWGGRTSGGDPAEDPGQGAVYDVADDSWTVLPAGPMTGQADATVMWVDGVLYVGRGEVSQTGGGDPGAMAVELASYDPATQRWAVEPSVPDPVGESQSQVKERIVPAGGTNTDARDAAAEFVRSGDYYLTPNGWQLTPSAIMYKLAEVTVALGSTPDELERSGESARFEVFTVDVRTASGWLPAADAPFPGRVGATVVPIDNVLLVVGGTEADSKDLVLADDAWVLNLTSPHPEPG
jgi:hypothetical protein